MRALIGLLMVVSASGWAQRPNIVLIVADDLGWKDVGYNGSEISTPNIDALATGGVTLTQFYVHATCSPTRAALMTGQSPMRHGIYHALGKNTEGSLPLSLKLLPGYLGEAGYQPVMVGKWHLGHATAAMLPMARGFEAVYGHFTGGVGYWDHVHGGGLDWHRDGVALREEGYATHLQAAEAVRLIKERDRGRPLFLYTAFSAPHLPNEAPAATIAEYAAIAAEPRRTHAAMVDELDRAIGRIIAALAEERMLENTLVWFFSDNGGLNPAAVSDGMRRWVARLVALFGRPLPTGFLEFLRHNTEDGGSDNGPYRRGKGAVYQGGILVPSVLSWPGTLQPASIRDRVTVQDVLPTLAEVVGFPLQATQAVDGAARWAAINGTSGPADVDFVAVSRDDRAVLSGHWKLVTSGAVRELYNLAKDPYETSELAAEQPRVVEQLEAVIDGIPQRESINQSLFEVMLDMDRFGGDEDRPPWADVVRQVPGQ
ncbi:MAG: sulfatase-like hydrolase/transferase [Pseudomonadota bacterium]